MKYTSKEAEQKKLVKRKGKNGYEIDYSKLDENDEVLCDDGETVIRKNDLGLCEIIYDSENYDAELSLSK